MPLCHRCNSFRVKQLEEELDYGRRFAEEKDKELRRLKQSADETGK